MFGRNSRHEFGGHSELVSARKRLDLSRGEELCLSAICRYRALDAGSNRCLFLGSPIETETRSESGGEMAEHFFSPYVLGFISACQSASGLDLHPAWFEHTTF